MYGTFQMWGNSQWKTTNVPLKGNALEGDGEHHRRHPKATAERPHFFGVPLPRPRHDLAARQRHLEDVLNNVEHGGAN